MTQDLATLTRLEAQVQHLVETLLDQRRVGDERWAKIEPIILERSGLNVRNAQFDKDVNAIGDKVRRLGERLDALEAWRDRYTWVTVGAIAAVQFLVWLIPVLFRFVKSGL